MHIPNTAQKYEELKRDLILVERYMLREFGFIMHVDHPHKFVLNYLTILDVSKELRTKADQGGVDAEALKEVGFCFLMFLFLMLLSASVSLQKRFIWVPASRLMGHIFGKS